MRASRRRSSRREARASFPHDRWARLVEVGFQGEVKKALVELRPLAWDEERGRLVLTRRIVVEVAFRGREASERDENGGRGRRYRPKASQARRDVFRRLSARDGGLYVVPFEEVFGRRGRSVSASSLRLSRGDELVPFHLEPEGERFGPGSHLYFLSPGSRANPFGEEAVYELELSSRGATMQTLHAAPAASPLSFYWSDVEREENRFYQAGLTKAPDRWLWEPILTSDRKSFRFEVTGLAFEAIDSELEIDLQGTTDLAEDPEHHLRAYVNGHPVVDGSWNGKESSKLVTGLPPGILREGDNVLELENVNDMGVAYSMVMLDRFRVRYPRRLDGAVEERAGFFATAGTAELSDGGERLFVLDDSPGGPRWLRVRQENGSARFGVEEGRHYRMVPQSALQRPGIATVGPARLKLGSHQADYLLIGPRVFLEAAEPLAKLRRSQGLSVSLVATEQIYSEFGFGEERPEAIQDFLAFAYHRWRAPSPRYVLLLRDATYDFKDYLRTGVKNQVPPSMIETTYLWTVSDPSYAAINGEDRLPDVAIGRLPAASLEEARRMVGKILDYESSRETMGKGVVLVADDADAAGDFPGDAETIARRFFANQPLQRIYLSDLGASEARRRIVQAFDDGAELLSYVGHGGIHLWAAENLLDTTGVHGFSQQTHQPLVLTMNCLNGYFHFPYFDSLSEALLKLEGRGAIAAFSPSGLSLNGPAQIYHQALVGELVSGHHERLGDAIVAAQAAYADSGSFPELLSIYHLLGDPALRLR